MSLRVKWLWVINITWVWASAFQYMELGSNLSHLKGRSHITFYINVLFKADLQVICDRDCPKSCFRLSYLNSFSVTKWVSHPKCSFHIPCLSCCSVIPKIINLADIFFPSSCYDWFLLAFVKFCVLAYSSLWKPHLPLCLTASGFRIFAARLTF